MCNKENSTCGTQEYGGAVAIPAEAEAVTRVGYAESPI